MILELGWVKILALPPCDNLLNIFEAQFLKLENGNNVGITKGL